MAAIYPVCQRERIAQRTEAKRGRRGDHLHGGLGLPVDGIYLGFFVRRYVSNSSRILWRCHRVVDK